MAVMDGVLVVDKPEGWTSHDAVARVKKALGAAKVGHLGTLDPLATGVLPLVVGRATKSARLMEGGVKTYAAVIRLGEETETLDREGRVTASSDASGVTGEAVAAALERFRGRITQMPPMFSAAKVNGVPLYRLARKGVVVEREPKEVEIYSIRLVDFRPPLADLIVECSRGTFVRVLASDAGKLLGCGAHLWALRRTGCGPFTEDESVSPTADRAAMAERLIPLAEALRRFSGPTETRPAGIAASR